MSEEYDILIELSADDMKKAADEREHRDAEITRLRAENEKFFKQAEMNARLLTENASLRAENEKLRFERDTIGEANYVNGWTDAINSSEAMQDLRAENDQLRKDVKTAIMGDSAELQDVKRENERLRAENEKLRKAQEQLGMFFIKIGDKGYYVCEAIWREFELLRETKTPYRDGFSDGVQHERQRISYENKKLREALKPFAYYASQIPDDVSDTAAASGTVGDLRAAAKALGEMNND